MFFSYKQKHIRERKRSFDKLRRKKIEKEKKKKKSRRKLTGTTQRIWIDAVWNNGSCIVNLPP